MGVKPTPIQNEMTCTPSPWTGGYVPASLLVGIEGMEKIIPGDPTCPEPPNGIWQLDFVNCHFWYLFANPWSLQLTVENGLIKFRADWGYLYVGFYAEIPIEDPYRMSNANPYPTKHKNIGSAYGYLWLDGFHLPPEWDAAPLFGVPEIEGYFAEEFPSTKAERYMRYAAHRDGTNIKIWTGE